MKIQPQFNAPAEVGAFVIVVALTASLILAIRNAPRSAQRRSIDELSWIAGCWSMQTPRGSTVTEHWTRPSRDTLAGTSRTVRNDITVASEIMHIFARGDTIIFAALPSGQTYTEFRATSIDSAAATFENPAHDFPQRVIYRAAPDSLYGRIEGTLNGAFRSADFPMRRQECAG